MGNIGNAADGFEMHALLTSLRNRLGRFLDDASSRSAAEQSGGSLGLGQFSALTRP